MSSTPLYKQKWFIPTLVIIGVLIVAVTAVVLILKRKQKREAKAKKEIEDLGYVEEYSGRSSSDYLSPFSSFSSEW